MKKSTLKIFLIGILLIFAIVPTLVLGVVGSFAVVNYSRTVRENELKTVSLAKSGGVDAVFMGYTNAVQALANMESVKRSIANRSNDTNKSNEGQNELDAFTNASDDIIDCLILNNEGKVIAASKIEPGSIFENYPDNNNLSAVSGLLSWSNYSNDAIYFSHEVKVQSGNIGYSGYVVIVVDVGPNSRIGNALSGTYLDGNAHLFLADNDGNTVNFRTDEVLKSEQLDNSLRENIGTIFSTTESANGQNTIDTVQTDKAGKYTIVYGAIPNITTWRWIGITNSSSMISFASSANIKLLLVSAVIFVLSALIAFMIVSKFISNMQKMLKSINSINMDDGVENIRFETKHDNGELGSIQDSFNEFMEEVYLNGERYRTISALSDNMLFEWDFHKERMYVSDNVLAKFDIDISSATLSNGKFLDFLMDQEFADKYKRDINTLLKNQGSYSSEYQLKSKSGANVWVSCKATCVSDRMGDPLRVIGVLTDIDNEKKLEMQLSERASFDFLSQLFNRSTFLKKLATELDHRGPNNIGVMFIDVDDFKFINDRYGHAVGDEVIRFVADTIRLKVDDRGGFAGRFGGDEFVLCYTNQDDIANLEQIAMDLIDELYLGYTTADGMLINVRASIGISYCPLHTDDTNELVAFADTAMYFVKKNGKTNYHVYVPEDSESGEYNDPEYK